VARHLPANLHLDEMWTCSG